MISDTISKKLLNLNIALSRIFYEDDLLKISSLKRSVNIDSYAGKFMSLFFQYLANDLKDMSKEHQEKLDELNRLKANKPALSDEVTKQLDEINKKISKIGAAYGINNTDKYQEILWDSDGTRFDSIPGEITGKLNRLLKQYNNISSKSEASEPPREVSLSSWKNGIIKIYIKPNRSTNAIEVFYENEPRGSSKKLIKEQPLNEGGSKFFTDDELKIFLASGHVINVHLRNADGGDEKIRAGAVTGGKWVVYNPSISYDKRDPGLLIFGIELLYNDLLDYIVHESTHVQQFAILDKASEIAQDISLDDFNQSFNRPNKEFSYWEIDKDKLPLITDRGYVNTKNKKLRDDWVKSISVEEKQGHENVYEDDEDLESMPPIVPEDEDFDSPESFLNRQLGRCPEVLEIARREILQKLKEDKDLDYIAEVFKYRDMCDDEKKSILSKNKSETFHKEKDIEKPRLTAVQRYTEYISQPVEVEAHIRGWRSKLKGTGKTLAHFFGSYVAKGLGSPDNISKVWSLFEAAYRRLGYPEKDLGTYDEVLSAAGLK
jgi:hypothetical protein